MVIRQKKGKKKKKSTANGKVDSHLAQEENIMRSSRESGFPLFFPTFLIFIFMRSASFEDDYNG